jgi:tRNA(adenine34) deaminase
MTVLTVLSYYVRPARRRRLSAAHARGSVAVDETVLILRIRFGHAASSDPEVECRGRNSVGGRGFIRPPISLELVPSRMSAIELPPSDQVFMARALELARHAEREGEVPVGAVVVKDGVIVGEGWNRPIGTHDPTAHAEIVALRAAARALGTYRLLDTTLYVTWEPCAMCAGAMVHARVKRLVFAATDPRAGAAGSIFNIVHHEALNHRLSVASGILAEECSALLRGFFLARR